jgi:hypothetical protein
MWDRPAPIPDAWKQEAAVRADADRAARERAAEASVQRQREEQRRELGSRERNARYDNLDDRNFVVATDHLSREIDRRYAQDPSLSNTQIKDRMCREYMSGEMDRTTPAAQELFEKGHVHQFRDDQTRQRAIDLMKERQNDQERERGQERGDDLERGR